MNKLSIGTWITIYSEAIAEIMSSSGYDWVTIDLEHTPISLSQAEKLIRVIDLNDCKPYVRVSSNSESEIKRVLDFGAKGIIVPMICNAGDIKKAIESCFYPPKGNRGMGLNRSHGYGENIKKTDYINNTSDEIEVFATIESKEALKNLDDIFQQDITGYIIGPYDLSSSIGEPGNFFSDEFIAAEKLILETAKKYKIRRGIHVVEPDLDQLKEKIKDGYNFIAYSVDFRMLDESLRKPFQDA